MLRHAEGGTHKMSAVAGGPHGSKTISSYIAGDIAQSWAAAMQRTLRWFKGFGAVFGPEHGHRGELWGESSIT